ncbi:hypothetical protein [Enterococcus raffinosus]|uniref:hypothetical protein n=1 Tax=Enterococcus raffinosus TaxID=71452 RepID=UPI001C957BD4|nr:hypothetical protein [Enterococcus raffinosus]QZO10728.1 hypothetical protein K5P74_18440 [Enterococcus raffinosus]
MIKINKKVLTAFLFVGLIGLTSIEADGAATSRQGIQELRYCTINNIYKAPQVDCLLRQDRILNQLNQDTAATNQTAARPQDGSGARLGNGKQDGTGLGRADGPRVPDCPYYEEKQIQTTPDSSTTPALETTNYGVQPQDGTGNQYGQQNTVVNNTQQITGTNYTGNASSVQQQANESTSAQFQMSTLAQQAGSSQQNKTGQTSSHHGLRDGSGSGGKRGRNAGHCY